MVPLSLLSWMVLKMSWLLWADMNSFDKALSLRKPIFHCSIIMWVSPYIPVNYPYYEHSNSCRKRWCWLLLIRMAWLSYQKLESMPLLLVDTYSILIILFSKEVLFSWSKWQANSSTEHACRGQIVLAVYTGCSVWNSCICVCMVCLFLCLFDLTVDSPLANISKSIWNKLVHYFKLQTCAA